VHQTIIDKVNAAINSIPGVSGVQVTKGEYSTTAQWKECCSSGQIKHETCCAGSLTLSANLGKITIYGGSFQKEVDFGPWGAKIEVTAAVYIGGTVSASATAGTYKDECGEGCLYGSASIGTTLSANAELTACCCIKLWGDDHCTPKIGVEGSASISFGGSVRCNQCDNCDGVHGEISLNSIDLSVSVNIGIWSGSLSYQIYP
jgi:hypothetical protein